MPVVIGLLLNTAHFGPKHPSTEIIDLFLAIPHGETMSLPKLTKSRLKTLKAIHGWQVVATWPKAALRLLARTDVAIEKLTITPKWQAGRIALQRFRIGRGPQTRPKHRIPNNGYRSTKISHWLKDHLRRIEDMAFDAVCAAATSFGAHEPPDAAVAAFNDHITPIAKLYDFKLQMVADGGNLVLRGDINKALSVLTYLCSSQRTPEVDWMLDVVTVSGQDQPFEWKRSWDRKLRHTKRGKWWRERRERQQAIAVAKERQRELERASLNATIDETINDKINYNPQARISSANPLNFTNAGARFRWKEMRKSRKI
jgi:hypothetical protein